MKQHLTADFQNQLWDAVKAIEQQSQAEVVVVFRERSGDYSSIPLLWGLLSAWMAHTYLMYAPAFFENWLVYFGPIIAFLQSYGLALLPTIKRLSVRKTALDKNVEVMGRAIFQKGGIHHTRDKIGVLIYCSWLEQRFFVLPDREVELAIPAEEWNTLRQTLNDTFSSKSPPDALLTVLGKTAAVFGRYLPIQEDDINDLPDQMEIDL